MAKKKTINNKPIWKTAGFYFVIIYALLTIAFIAQMFISNIVPMKYAIPVLIVLILIFMGMYYLQLGKRVNKVNKILGKVLIVILSIILGIGNWYVFKTTNAFGRMAGTNTQTDVVSVVVMKESNAKDIKDLKGKKLGVIKTGDNEIMTKALADVEKDLGEDITTVDYKSYKDYGDDLYDGKIDAILVNEGSRGLFEDNHANFDSETRKIKEYTYEKEVKDISKDVNVTKEPFSVYITGIDTFGTISTVSRSDVNMIVTVNPKTHQILLTSIPRDYYIPQPCQGGQTDKLTHSGLWGAECTVESVENYFDAEINYFARVNFSSVISIVDALGGITVENPVAFTASDGTYSYPAGNVDMDGAMALRFARERYNLADGDRDRGRNQMRVITAMINKMISPTIITNYSSIMDAIGGSFQTNMTSNEMSSLVKMQINDMSGWDIKQISVSGRGNPSAWSPANGFNAWVMEPNKATVDNATSLIKKVVSGELVTDEDVQHQNDLDASAG